MPELSIIMSLKDMITTKIKEIIELFNKLIGHTEEAAKRQIELTEKVKVDWKEHAEYRKDRAEWAKEEEKEYDREAELMEFVAQEQAKIHEEEVKMAEEEVKFMEFEAQLRRDLAEEEELIYENERKLMEFEGQLKRDLAKESEAEAKAEIELMEKTAEKRAEVSDEEVEILEKKTREWKRTFRSITEDQKAFYQKATGYMGDFREMTEEELEKVKELWEENVGRYEEIWDGFTQSVRTSFSALFVDFMDGTKKSQDIWQDFCDSLVKSFKKAIADSLVEKMGLDKLFEGNILNWGNLFGGLGNLISGVFQGLFGEIGGGLLGLDKQFSGFTSKVAAGLGGLVTTFGTTLSALVSTPAALALFGLMAITTPKIEKAWAGYPGGYEAWRKAEIAGFKREKERNVRWAEANVKAYEEQGEPELAARWRTWLAYYKARQRGEEVQTPGGRPPAKVTLEEVWAGKEGGAFLDGLRLLQAGAVFRKPTFFRGIAGEGGEPEILSPESLLRKIVREEFQRVPSSYSFGPINVQFPNVTSFQDWLDADPGTIKVIFDRKIYQAMKMSAREGRISKEALLM